VLSFWAYRVLEVSTFALLCRAARAALLEDDCWRHLAERHFYASKDRLANWPQRLTSLALYRALELWVPLEGFYVLGPAFPFGLLVLIRIEAGEVLGEVIDQPSNDLICLTLSSTHNQSLFSRLLFIV